MWSPCVLPYPEAKVDVTEEIEQRVQQAAQAGADHCALYSISCVTSTLASVYIVKSAYPSPKKLTHCITCANPCTCLI